MTLELQSEAIHAPPRSVEKSPLYLIDGHSLTFKAYYGVRGLTAPEGFPTGQIYGFLRMLLRLIEEVDPEFLAVVFDTGKPTFREKIFPAYKANREAPPPDFSDQMVWIYRFLKSMGIMTYELDGYEADDLIATMASEVTRAGQDCVIVSADKDLFQLVNDQVTVLRFGNRSLERCDESAVKDRLGVTPAQVPDWLALVGDSSDNIPGVPTIGSKGAARLLAEFDSLEDLIDRADAIKNERQRKSLLENVDQARLSRRLATVVRDVPLSWDAEACRLPGTLWSDDAIKLLAELGFDTIIKEKGLKLPEDFGEAQGIEADLDYRILTDAEELRRWVDEAAGARWLALDTETTGLDPMRAELVGMSFSFKKSEAIYIPVSHRVGLDVENQIPIEKLREILKPLLCGSMREGKRPRLTAHHAKYDWKILERAGFELAPPDFDSMVASFVLDPGRTVGHGLKALGASECGVRMRPITEIIGSGKKALTVAEVPAEAIYEYACQDADVTLRLTELFDEKLKGSSALHRLFLEVEMPLIPILHKMEMGGFTIDPTHLTRLSETMNLEINRLSREIWDLAGRQFNISSPLQLSGVLFEELGMPRGKKTKTGYSTDSRVLEELSRDHPLAQLVLDYRGLVKLKSTYADALPAQINPATGRIHTSFNQTIAQTGRLSSTRPNLQNIPIRTELGREIRCVFIPDERDHRILSADYSQIELRILAHFSHDTALVKAYDVGSDIHALTASQIFSVQESDVTAQMRAQAKVVNFGIIYGMSAHGLSQRLRITRGEAAQFIEAYFATYPGVRQWIDATLERAREDGYVETLMGRRRYLPDLTAKNGMTRSNAERIAINTPLQGSSADMIKLAMIHLDKGMEEAIPGTRMILQVHDELIFSLHEEKTDEAGKYIARVMCDALALDVPVVVDVAVGKNWAECR